MNRKRIIEAAIEVLNEDFYAPMEAIAEKAGLSRRTLHRHFSDRKSLIEACWTDMLITWQKAFITAYNSSENPLEQLKEMLEAGIDCGTKFSFLNKLRSKATDFELPETVLVDGYENLRNQWMQLIPDLQTKKLLHADLSAAWIRLLFINIINTAIAAIETGDIALNEIKKNAWYSFSHGIGIH